MNELTFTTGLTVVALGVVSTVAVGAVIWLAWECKVRG